ncbi:hypothetical protein GALMADRAFT_242324 [Galerina marginata CBS 339.88]|uniref:Required for respiratory growth protein 9, mitochondrial n=1 Tax=Galerina marginata (strain CBS 339.88) TaxID=685588 RepID=A0A067TCM1_GALM3|nr:hypothetical protein GALMADRAFT_242324 [Galerina marginata CBS 339.88]
MASWLRLPGIHQVCTRGAAFRYYSETPFQRATNKWQLGGVPKPRSILDDDDAVIDLSEDNEAVNGSNPNTPPIHLRKPSGKPTPHEYKAHRETMRKAFPDGWSPPRKLSREAMDALRHLNRIEPETCTTAVLADKFKISPEAVRRILKSKWEPSADKRTRLAIKEREQKQVLLKERMAREQEETANLQELQKMLRRDRYINRKGDSDPPDQRGLGARDTFTFQ